MMNVQQEPQAELSLDGDGTLLTDFAPPRVVSRFETNRLSQFLDYGKQLAHRSLGSAYSVVHATDDVARSRARSAFSKLCLQMASTRARRGAVTRTRGALRDGCRLG